MEAIIKRFYHNFLFESDIYKWLIVADDDTLLRFSLFICLSVHRNIIYFSVVPSPCSVPRLLRLLKCYNSSHPILLGEVYGYLAHLPGGTSYVTGGGRYVCTQSNKSLTSFPGPPSFQCYTSSIVITVIMH